MSLAGVLSRYPRPDPDDGFYPFFTSGDLLSTRAVVFIGGLTNGMMDPGHVVHLSGVLGGIGWKLIQMHWTSAYDGYLTSSLEKDVSEMDALVRHLGDLGTTHIVLMGHSTGCQNVTRYLSTRSNPLVCGGILQAPISDREWWERDESEAGEAARRGVDIARKMIDGGKGGEFMAAEYWTIGGKITADRFFSLVAIGGDDDYFSADIPADPSPPHAHPLSQTFGRFSAPALILYSGNDQYCAPGVEPYPKRMARWRDMAQKGTGAEVTWQIVKDANHGVTAQGPREEMGGMIRAWLVELSGARTDEKDSDDSGE